MIGGVKDDGSVLPACLGLDRADLTDVEAGWCKKVKAPLEPCGLGLIIFGYLDLDLELPTLMWAYSGVGIVRRMLVTTRRHRFKA